MPVALPTVSSIQGVSVAYGQNAWAEPASWTRLDTPTAPELMITEIRIQRGRQYLSDQNQAGTVEIDFTDTSGILDPTNTSSPLYPMHPNCPIAIGLFDPVLDTWSTIFRGNIQDVPTDLDTSENWTSGMIRASDAFDLLAANNLPAGYDYDSGGAGTVNNIGDTTLAAATVQERIIALLTIAGVPVDFWRVATGNVNVQPTVESPGSAILSLLQEAADAELPGASNVYVTKDGIVRFRGREQRFHPAAEPVAMWHVGDLSYVDADPAHRALASGLSWNFDVAKIVNDSLITPKGIQDAEIPTLEIADGTSITTYGLRSLQGQEIINAGHAGGGNTALDEVKLMNQFYVNNFKTPHRRVSKLTLKNPGAGTDYAARQWKILREIDLSDLVFVTTTHPGGGGFLEKGHFVEGINYTLRPLRGDTWLVQLDLDLSPQSFYLFDPFATEDSF